MEPLRFIAFTGDVPGLLAALPKGPGVGQLLGAEARSLTIGAPASLRKWAASNLGASKAPSKGRRPRTDLSPVTTALGFVETTSAFHQRVSYERLMARYVPLSARRDLKPPVFIHVDPAERFPRLTLRHAEDGLAQSYGPFRDRRSADKARAGLHKFIPLRPCDYVFEPDPALPLGLACLYAQVRSCAAPCLARISESAYRDLAGSVADLLARPWARNDEAAAILAPTVARASGRGLVIAPRKEGVELYPVCAGVVAEAARTLTTESLETAVAALRWDDPPVPGADWPWLTAWLQSPRGRRSYVALSEDESGEQLLSRIRARL